MAGAGPKGSFGQLLLIQLAILVVCSGGDELSADAVATGSSVQGGQHYEDLGATFNPDVPLPPAEKMPPTEVPKTPAGGKVPEDRRVVEIASQKSKGDPRRSQLHPDCQPFKQNMEAEIKQGKSCVQLCEENKCVSYQEFTEGDEYYPHGECKLYMCPPRFMSQDTRRSEVMPDCAPFSEHNSNFMKKSGATCSGMCSRAKGCKSYMEWKPGSEIFPQGECKLFKCNPKSDLVAAAQREADRVRQEAEIKLKAEHAIAERERKADELNAKQALDKAKRKAAELDSKAGTRELQAKEKAKQLTEKAQAEGKETTVKAKSKADGMKEEAEKAAQKMITAATTKKDNAVKEAAEISTKAAASKEAAEKHKTSVSKQAAELEQKGIALKYNATESADHTKAVASAKVKEIKEKADELGVKSKDKEQAAEKSIKNDRKISKEEAARNKAASASKAAEIVQKAQDAAQTVAEYAKGNATAIKTAASDDAQRIRDQVNVLKAKITKDTADEVKSKEGKNKEHAKQLEQNAAKEKDQKTTMLEQLLAKQKASEALIAQEKKQAEDAVAADEIKNKKVDAEKKKQLTLLEAQAKKDALAINVKAVSDKNKVEAQAAKTKADAAAIAAAEKEEKAKLNKVRIESLEKQAKKTQSDAAATEKVLQHEKQQVLDAEQQADENAQKKSQAIAKESETVEAKLAAGEQQAKEAQQKAVAANDRSASQNAAEELTNCQTSQAEIAAAETAKRIKCKNDKEVAAKAGVARKTKVDATAIEQQTSQAADDALSLCNSAIADASERGQKAKAILGGLSASQEAIKQAESNELFAKAEEAGAKGSECAEKASIKQQTAKVSLENAQNAAATAAKLEAKNLLNAEATCNAHQQIIAVASHTKQRCAAAMAAQKQIETREKQEKEAALQTMLKERNSKAKESEVLSKTFLKQNEKAKADAEAARQKEVIDETTRANNRVQDVDKVCKAAEATCNEMQSAKIQAAQESTNVDLKAKATSLEVSCEEKTNECKKQKSSEKGQKAAASKAASELEVKATTSKELAKKAGEAAERADAANKARELTEKVTETKSKVTTAKELREKAEAAKVEPDKKLAAAQAAAADARKIDEAAQAKVEAAKSKLKTVSGDAELASQAEEAAKESLKKAEMNYQAESPPYKDAAKTLKAASQKVEAAAAKVNALGGKAESVAVLDRDLEVLELLDLGQTSNSSNATFVLPPDQAKRTAGRLKRREERYKEHAEKAEEKGHKAKQSEMLSAERATKSAERKEKSVQYHNASAQLLLKSEVLKAQMGGANSSTIALLTQSVKDTVDRASEAGTQAKELESKAKEKLEKSQERATEAKERRAKVNENKGKAQGAENLMKAGEARSEAASKQKIGGGGNEIQVKNKEQVKMAAQAAAESGKEQSAQDRLTAAIAKQERLAKEAQAVEAKKEAVNERVTKAEGKKEKAVTKAQQARSQQTTATNSHDAALTQAKISKEKASKSAASYAALDTRVNRLTVQTAGVDTAMKRLAADDLSAQHAAESAVQEQAAASETAHARDAQSANANEAAAKAVEAKNEAKKKFMEAEAKRTEAAEMAATAAQLAQTTGTAATSAQADKEKLQQDLATLEQAERNDKDVKDAAAAKVEAANAAAAQAGDTAVVNLRTEVTGATATLLDQVVQTSFGEAVAATLGIGVSKVTVSKVTGTGTLTLHYTVHQSDLASATAIKATMSSANPKALMDTFREKATELGKTIEAGAEITATSGSVSENLTPEQQKTRADLKVAIERFDNVTAKVASATQKSSLATLKAEEAKTASEAAIMKKAESAATLTTAKGKMKAAESTVAATAQKSAEVLKRQESLEAEAKSAEATSANSAGAAESSASRQQTVQNKLTTEEKKQKILADKLDQSAEQRASANVISGRDNVTATEAAGEEVRLRRIKVEADFAAKSANTEAEHASAEAARAISERDTLNHRLVVLEAETKAATAEVQRATKAHQDAQESIAKEGAEKAAEKQAAVAASVVQADKIAKGVAGKTVYKVEVSSKMDGMKASEFSESLKTAYIASVAASLGVDTGDVVINSVDDVSELMVQRLGDSADGGSVEVSYSVATASEAAGNKAKAAVAAIDPAALTETFKAEAATLGAAVPANVKVDKPVAGEIVADNTNTKVAELQAAVEVLSAEKARMEMAEVGVKKYKDRYEAAQERLTSAEDKFKTSQQKYIDVEGLRKVALDKVQKAEAEQRKTSDSVNVAESAVKAATEASAAADAFFKKSDLKLQLAAGVAASSWAEFLKGDADKKSADAKAKTGTKLDPWNIALAKSASEPGICQGTAQKFQTIIIGARNATLVHAKESCVESGKQWADFEAKVQSEVATQTADLRAKHSELLTKHKGAQAARVERASLLDSVQEFLDVDLL